MSDPQKRRTPAATGEGVQGSNAQDDTRLRPPDGIDQPTWLRIARADRNRWAIAERNAQGEVIGTAYRLPDGGKDFGKGGKRGLILPWPLGAYAGSTERAPVFIAEGASDTAALLGLGLDAVGVPMAGQCGAMLAELLAGRHAVMVADADDPGRNGAVKLAKTLAKSCASVRSIEPPSGAKDARASVIAGADRAAFELLAALAEPVASDEDAGTGAGDAAKGDDGGEGKKPTQAEQLVRLAEELCRFGQTPKREPFAVLNAGPNVALRLGGAGGALRDILAREYRRRFGRVVNSTAYTDAIAAIRGEAMDADPESTALRVAPHGGGIVLDLGTTDGAVVVVDAKGWRVVDRSPVLFTRTALTGALPKPTPGGDLADLRALLNVTDETWPVLLGWLVAGLLPDMPHPVLMLGGQQGAGKTTAARFLCGLFDPSDAPIRSQPRDPETWAISVANGWTAVIDNVSTIPEWWSDALCKAVTGDGWVRRTLYTDGDVSVLSFRRVIVLTSIDAGALRGDLGERLVLVDLLPIPPERRMTERELDATYAALRPALLGALLDLVAKVLARLDTVKVPTLPRMADFARVLAAMDAATGTDALRLYGEQGKRIAGEVLDADPVGEAVARFMASRREWVGTMKVLLDAIRPDEPGREWPKQGRGLGARLRRLAPALEVQGVRVIPPSPTDKRRGWVLQTTAPTAQPPKNATGAPPSGVGAGGSVLSIAQPPNDRPRSEPQNGPMRADSGLWGCLGGSTHATTEAHADGGTWADGSPITVPSDADADPAGEVIL